MDFLTNAFRSAYEVGRSTIDVLYTKWANRKRRRGNRTICDISLAFGYINREITQAVIFERGITCNLIKIIRIRHHNTFPRPKNNAEIDAKTENRCVFQGIPLSAYLL